MTTKTTFLAFSHNSKSAAVLWIVRWLCIRWCWGAGESARDAGNDFEGNSTFSSQRSPTTQQLIKPEQL